MELKQFNCLLQQEGMPLSVPTSAAALQQRKRLWPATPAAADAEKNFTVVATTSQPQQQRQLEWPCDAKKARHEIEKEIIDESRCEMPKADVNDNISAADVISPGRAVSPTFGTESSSELLHCPAHYDAEVWDALPRDLQLEILGETVSKSGQPSVPPAGQLGMA
jgi:hypothetical protein